MDLENPGSSMYSVTRWFGRLRYGFDLETVYLRLERSPGQGPEDMSEMVLRVRFHGRADHFADIPLGDPSAASLRRLRADLSPGEPTPVPRARAEHGNVQLGVPFAALGAEVGDSLSVTAHLLRDRVELGRFPPAQDVMVVVPDEDFEDVHWSV